MKKNIIITGAAGLVGQNLLILLSQAGYRSITAIDRNEASLKIAQRLNPHINIQVADLAIAGSWQDTFKEAACVIQLQAEITNQSAEAFKRNNLTSTKQVVTAAKTHHVPYLIHISSSVVNSLADDEYVRTKTTQEKIVSTSGLSHCIFRPTLMFGWFDPKHLGWLAGFLEKTPLFPLPGNGAYLRQPLFAQDFCRLIQWAIEQQPRGNPVYDICGQEAITYAEIIRSIREVKKLKTPIVPIPIPLFRFLMRAYGWFFANPPFTPEQLDALIIPEQFSGENIKETFGITPTPFKKAIKETFTHSQYANIALSRFSNSKTYD